MGLPRQLLERKRHEQSYRTIAPFRWLPWSSMVSNAPGTALCPETLAIHPRCWQWQLQGCVSQSWTSLLLPLPEGLTLPAAMAPGCQLALEGLLCPQEAGSRRLARSRALGFAGQTERQLPSSEQRRCPLPWQEQRPKETLKPCCVPWVHSEDRIRGAHSAPPSVQARVDTALPGRLGPHRTSSTARRPTLEAA